MYLHINFDKIALTQGKFCADFPEWIAKKKAVINPKMVMNSVLNELLLQHFIANTKISISRRTLRSDTIFRK